MIKHKSTNSKRKTKKGIHSKTPISKSPFLTHIFSETKSMTHKTPQEREREIRTLAWIVEETISLRALACTSRLRRLSSLQRRIFWLEDGFKGFGSGVLVLICYLKKI